MRGLGPATAGADLRAGRQDGPVPGAGRDYARSSAPVMGRPHAAGAQRQPGDNRRRPGRPQPAGRTAPRIGHASGAGAPRPFAAPGWPTASPDGSSVLLPVRSHDRNAAACVGVTILAVRRAGRSGDRRAAPPLGAPALPPGGGRGQRWPEPRPLHQRCPSPVAALGGLGHRGVTTGFVQGCGAARDRLALPQGWAVVTVAATGADTLAQLREVQVPSGVGPARHRQRHHHDAEPPRRQGCPQAGGRGQVRPAAHRSTGRAAWGWIKPRLPCPGGERTCCRPRRNSVWDTEMLPTASGSATGVGGSLPRRWSSSRP